MPTTDEIRLTDLARDFVVLAKDATNVLQGVLFLVQLHDYLTLLRIKVFVDNFSTLSLPNVQKLIRDYLNRCLELSKVLAE